jgi:hypothetical protein
VPAALLGSGPAAGVRPAAARWLADGHHAPPQLGSRGKAVQVEPMELMLEAPGPKLLKLNYDKLLSNFAFKINLRRYTEAAVAVAAAEELSPPTQTPQELPAI